MCVNIGRKSKLGVMPLNVGVYFTLLTTHGAVVFGRHNDLGVEFPEREDWRMIRKKTFSAQE